MTKVTIERETLEKLADWIDNLPVPTPGASAWGCSLRAALDQPFQRGQHTLVYNGEIYNFRALRAALTRDGARYRWLKAQKSIDLQSNGGEWTRKDGTRFFASHRLCAGDRAYAVAETLDATIDAAMKDQPIWDQLAEIGASDPKAWESLVTIEPAPFSQQETSHDLAA